MKDKVKSKSSLIFRIISLVLIQAFLVMDIAWAAGGNLLIATKDLETSNLAPKLNLKSEDILNSYLYRVNGPGEIQEASLILEQPVNADQEQAMGRRDFFKFIGSSSIKAAAVLVGADLALSQKAESRELVTNLRDLVVSFDQNILQAELNKYIAIIETQGLNDFYKIEKVAGKTLIRIQGLFPLNAEKIAFQLNAQTKVRGLNNDFLVSNSVASWEKSFTYTSMQTFADQVVDVSTDLGFGDIDSKQLIGLYEGITWVESKFHQWQVDVLGRIKPVKSYTNAVGVTQVIRSQAVKQIVQWIVTYKGGMSRYAEIMNELERMVLNDREKLSRAIKEGKELAQETAVEKQFNVYDNLLAYQNANLDIVKEEKIIRALHRKIDSNPKLVGVNLYYALSVWKYLQQRNNLSVSMTSEIAQSIGQTAESLTIIRNNKKGALVLSGYGAYKPSDVNSANLQFERDYFRLNVIYKMIGPEKIAELLNNDHKKVFEETMKYLSQQMMTKVGNQRLGYTYLTLNWDRYRRLVIRKAKSGKYRFKEHPLSYFKNNSNGFAVSLAAAASYNAGIGSVDNALFSFGSAVDNNNIPLWIKNMVGANPQNIREPINYLRVFLEDKFINTGNLSAEEQKIKTDLVLERYKRIYKIKDRLLERRNIVRKNGVRIYSDYKRKDSFDYKLAFLIAQIAGSDYVDSFLRSYGLGKRWETEIFGKTTPIFDMLAFALTNQNDPNHVNALSLQQYLADKQFKASLAYLDERIDYFKVQDQAKLARVELAQQMAKEAQLQKTVAVLKTWVKRSAVGTAAFAAAGGLAWIMRRRVNAGKQAVPAPIYVLPLQILGLIGYRTVQLFVISGKIIVGAGKSFINLFTNQQRSLSVTKRSSLLNQQKVVRPNRRLNKKKNFLIVQTIKKFFMIITLIAILAIPFSGPTLSNASQKQAQAPPAVSMIQEKVQNDFNSGLIEISKNSNHQQLNDQGQLTTIRAKLGNKLRLSNSKARERESQINQLVEGGLFYDKIDLEPQYYYQKWQKVGYDFLGTMIFNIIPLIAGWLVLKVFGEKRRGSFDKSGNKLLLGRKNLSRNRRNRFRSTVLIPILALQFNSLLNPEITQAAGVFSLDSFLAVGNAIDSALSYFDSTTKFSASLLLALVLTTINKGKNKNDDNINLDTFTDKMKEGVEFLGVQVEKMFSLDPERQVIVAIDGAANSGKSVILEYIRQNGLAGIDFSDILILERDVIADNEGFSRNYTEANIVMLEKWRHNKKLVILNGNGIWTDGIKVESLGKDYNVPDVYVKLQMDENDRQRLIKDGPYSHIRQNMLIRAKGPSAELEKTIANKYGDPIIIDTNSNIDNSGKTESKDGEVSLKDKFKIGQLDTVIFLDVDLMRLTNQYVAKKNVNLLLDVLEAELETITQEMGAENAVSLRRGGDEFVLAINSQTDKQLAVDIASRIKQNVQSTKFSVASIGTAELSEQRIAEIESFGCSIDKIGKYNIIIVSQEIGGKIGKARIQEFIDIVNTMDSEHRELKIHSSWLNRPAVGNEVSFTLSIGVANISEVEKLEGENAYAKVRNLAAQRKDKSKEIFKKIGDGNIENQSDFERSGVAGESILLTAEAKDEFSEFNSIQRDSNLIEADKITDGFILENYKGVTYFSTENAARINLQQRMDNAQLEGAISFSLQGLDYFDQVGRDEFGNDIVDKIGEYQKEYYDSPGAVKDNRVAIRDFKVVNEAHGYVAGDEILGRLRIGAMRFAKLFDNFDVILARGPPSGPNGFLVPKTEQAKEINSAEIEKMFLEYMNAVRGYFNRPGESLVKVGHLRVIWDRVSLTDKKIGEVMERVGQARSVHEYIDNPENESDRVFQYQHNIQDTWKLLEEQNAKQAVEQLANLQAVWNQNKQQIDALAIEAEIFNSSNMIAPQGSVLLEQNIGIKAEQSI